MSNLVEYAKRELELIGGKDDETQSEMQSMMNDNIIELIEKFSEQGHSGFSASYLINALERLMRFKPITPLTGDAFEWNDVDGNGTFQNKRCSSVFKQKDGTCEDIDSMVVSDDGGITWFYSNRFRKKVEFPYTPPTRAEKVYIEYTEDGPAVFTGDKYDYDIITDDSERIKALYARKREEFDKVWEETE